MLIKYDSKLIILEASDIALLLEPADSISLCFFNIHTQTNSQHTMENERNVHFFNNLKKPKQTNKKPNTEAL